MASTAGEKELKTNWDELTASDSSKKIGHKQNLTSKKSNVLDREREGI
jgi:hypothetical protein